MKALLDRIHPFSVCLVALLACGLWLSTAAMADSDKEKNREESRKDSVSERLSHSRGDSDRSERRDEPRREEPRRQEPVFTASQPKHEHVPSPMENAFGRNGTLAPRRPDEPENYSRERLNGGQIKDPNSRDHLNSAPIWWSTGDRLLHGGNDSGRTVDRYMGAGSNQSDRERERLQTPDRPVATTPPHERPIYNTAGRLEQRYEEPTTNPTPTGRDRYTGGHEPSTPPHERPTYDRPATLPDRYQDPGPKRYSAPDIDWSVGDANLRRQRGGVSIWDTRWQRHYSTALTIQHRCFDRYEGGRFYYRHPNLEIRYGYYYPYYSYYRPSWGSVYPSIYCYYGPFYPPYVIAEQVVIVAGALYSDYDRADDDDYYLSRYNGISYRETLADIRDAWLQSDIRKLDTYLQDEGKVAIYLKGKYRYSVSTLDFYTMTRDAMSEVTTEGFEWVHIDKVGSSRVTAVARHTFRDRDGARHTVYASYMLGRKDGNWWIISAGSGDKAIVIQ